VTKFEEFINSKPMAYKEIDLNRMPEAFQEVRESFEIPHIIHVVGTNGKGSTGRFIAEMLRANGFKVGHYTSPHITTINERFWRDGELISDDELDRSHRVLQRLLSKKQQNILSYFEYTTLMTLPIYDQCHWLVMEAGLGGEFDATNVFPKKLSVFTPIGFDHQFFLGDTLEEIASTKFRSIGKVAVIAQQKYDEVYSILERVATDNESRVYRAKVKRGLSFIEENFETAKKALQLLGVMNLEFKASDFELPSGRLERVAGNITLDVGHNTLSAERVAGAIKGKFRLIYNSLDDKPYREILEILKPKIEIVEILPIDDDRAVSREELEKTLIELDIPFQEFKSTSKKNKYLVFGSFKVVEEFKKRAL
jgi:dihydrofolate synthase/folylpolyglutamate synthase